MEMQTKEENYYHQHHKITESSSDEKSLLTCKRLLSGIFVEYRGNTAIKLWNDETVIGGDGAEFTLTINRPQAVGSLVMNTSLTPLVEAHLSGDIDGKGNLEKVFDLIDYLKERRFSFTERVGLFCRALAIAGKKSMAGRDQFGKTGRNGNSRETIAHHYDVHNDFYRLFLDPEMIYSCAYFSDANSTLEQAQRDKLDYLCRKLRLEAGQTLLDIGCGWGGLSIWAARNYGVQVHGITLSREQFDYARGRASQLKLDDKVTFELRDYRDLPAEPRYDRIVSVGMFEHIGVDNFPVYFGKVNELLKPGGLFLNHGITNDTGWRDTPSTRFINTYIFPDGELARISDVTSAMEEQSLEILDVEGLRPHYVMTLRHWIKQLEKNRQQAIAIAGERTFRLWQLYMAGSAHYFAKGSTGLYQILACKSRQPWPLPLRRNDLYQYRNSDSLKDCDCVWCRHGDISH